MEVIQGSGSISGAAGIAAPHDRRVELGLIGIATNISYEITWSPTGVAGEFSMEIQNYDKSPTIWRAQADGRLLAKITNWTLRYREDQYGFRTLYYEFGLQKLDHGTQDNINITAALVHPDGTLLMNPSFNELAVSCNDPDITGRQRTWKVYPKLTLATRFHVYPDAGAWSVCG